MAIIETKIFFLLLKSFPSPSAQTSVLSPSVPPIPAPPQAIQRLKDQNHLLTQVQQFYTIHNTIVL